jgi:hypothetical protein
MGGEESAKRKFFLKAEKSEWDIRRERAKEKTGRRREIYEEIRNS